MKWLMITNNRNCYEQWGETQEVLYKEEWTYLDVLLMARDYVQRGYQLLSHPMAGSLKPNQMPYRSILLSKEGMEDKEPFADELLMENSIAAYHKFYRNRPLTNWPENIKADFRTVDLSLMEGAVGNHLMRI